MNNSLLEEAIVSLKTKADPNHLQTMKRFGVPTENAFGVKSPDIKVLAKRYKNQHQLAMDLWNTSIHEARMLAGHMADPSLMTDEIMEQWVTEIDSWDICDNTCKLFAHSGLAQQKAEEWSARPAEFEKRAGFVTMVNLAIHDKKASNEAIAYWLPFAEREAWDNRNFVKKAVNWLIRQVGKRNLDLRREALATAHKILEQPHPSAHWIARDAIRELNDRKIVERLEQKAQKAQSYVNSNYRTTRD